MRAVSRVAFVGWFLVLAGGCAAVTGLDSISEKDCAPLCGDAQATKDVTVDVPGQDSTAPETSQGMDTGMVVEAAPDDTSAPLDAKEASTKEAGTDAPVEAPSDGPIAPEGSSPDAPFDSGCGALNTTTNCSACGDKCAAVGAIQTSASCSGDTNGFGATCSYSCASGNQDCNAANPPNVDGCECHVAGATQANCCLGTGTCPITHNNGLNQASSRFFDCVTYASAPSQVAQDACGAYAGTTAQCSVYGCIGLDGGANGDQMWCSDGNLQTDCICWTFTGPDQGHMFDSKQKCPGFCPQLTDPTYN